MELIKKKIEEAVQKIKNDKNVLKKIARLQRIVVSVKEKRKKH